jgi:hypothetical protein
LIGHLVYGGILGAMAGGAAGDVEAAVPRRRAA